MKLRSASAIKAPSISAACSNPCTTYHRRNTENAQISIRRCMSANIKSDTLKEVNIFLDDYYDRYTGLYMKSKSFLKQLEKINQI